MIELTVAAWKEAACPCDDIPVNTGLAKPRILAGDAAQVT
jgi:hypothetical protein